MELDFQQERKDKCHFVLRRNKAWHTEVHKWLSWSHYYHSHEASSCLLFLLFLYPGCINHVLYKLLEFNAKNDVNLFGSLAELLVSTQTFSLTSVEYSILTLSFISKSDKSTWPVRSCLIHTTCQKINNNCEFGRWQNSKREHYL